MTGTDEPNGTRSREPFTEPDLRIGDRERDDVTQALHDAFAQGRITHEELDERLDATLAARTAGDLRRVTADLPGSHGHDSHGPHSRQGSPGSYGSQGSYGPRDPHHPPWHADVRWPARRPWAAFPGDPGSWGHQADVAQRMSRHADRHAARAYRHATRRAYRHANRGRHGGGPHPGVLILAVLVVSALVSGVVWPLFAAVKVIFFIWLAVAVAGLIRHRRWHHHHRTMP